MRRTLLTIGLLIAFTAPAVAMPAPDASTLALWRAEQDAGVRVRFKANGATLAPNRFTLDTTGVDFRGRDVGALTTFEASPAPDTHLAWDKIQSVEMSKGSHLARGAAIGSLVGVGVGAVLFIAIESALTANGLGAWAAADVSQKSSGFIMRSALVGAGIGAFIGSGSPHWHTVAP